MKLINKIFWGFCILTMLLGLYNIININYKYENCLSSYHCNILEDGLNLNYKIVDAINLCSFFIIPFGSIIVIIVLIKKIRLVEE